MALSDAYKSSGTEADTDAGYPTPRAAWWTVIVLMLIYVNSFLDRSILALLVDPIRRTLDISESQMGLLMGPAFAVFYIVAGLPLGRLADTFARRWVIFWGQLLWSVMSVACGFIKSFPQFLTLRMGLGVGEASLSPSAYSMITDSFRPAQLARALSVYGFGIYLGSGLARVLGGLVVGFTEGRDTVVLPIVGHEIWSWQVVFLFVALPTIPLSIILLMLKEPARREAHRSPSDPVRTATMGETLRYIRSNARTFFSHSFGFALLSFSGYGVGAWMPSHFLRNLGWGMRDIGIALGLVNIVGGTLGILIGGWLADTLHQRGIRANKTVTGLISCIAWLPAGIAYPLMPSGWATIACFFPAVVIAAMPWGVGPAGIQEIMPNRMRGQASGIYLFIINLLGLGFGPYILSLVTQYVFHDDSGVRYSLLLVPVVAHLIAAVLLFSAMKPFQRSLQRLEEWHASNR